MNSRFIQNSYIRRLDEYTNSQIRLTTRSLLLVDDKNVKLARAEKLKEFKKNAIDTKSDEELYSEWIISDEKNCFVPFGHDLLHDKHLYNIRREIQKWIFHYGTKFGQSAITVQTAMVYIDKLIQLGKINEIEPDKDLWSATALLVASKFAEHDLKLIRIFDFEAYVKTLNYEMITKCEKVLCTLLQWDLNVVCPAYFRGLILSQTDKRSVSEDDCFCHNDTIVLMNSELQDVPYSTQWLAAYAYFADEAVTSPEIQKLERALNCEHKDVQRCLRYLISYQNKPEVQPEVVVEDKNDAVIEITAQDISLVEDSQSNQFVPSIKSVETVQVEEKIKPAEPSEEFKNAMKKYNEQRNMRYFSPGQKQKLEVRNQYYDFVPSAQKKVDNSLRLNAPTSHFVSVWDSLSDDTKRQTFVEPWNSQASSNGKHSSKFHLDKVRRSTYKNNWKRKSVANSSTQIDSKSSWDSCDETRDSKQNCVHHKPNVRVKSTYYPKKKMIASHKDVPMIDLEDSIEISFVQVAKSKRQTGKWVSNKAIPFSQAAGIYKKPCHRRTVCEKAKAIKQKEKQINRVTLNNLLEVDIHNSRRKYLTSNKENEYGDQIAKDILIKKAQEILEEADKSIKRCVSRPTISTLLKNKNSKLNMRMKSASVGEQLSLKFLSQNQIMV